MWMNMMQIKELKIEIPDDLHQCRPSTRCYSAHLQSVAQRRMFPDVANVKLLVEKLTAIPYITFQLPYLVRS